MVVPKILRFEREGRVRMEDKGGRGSVSKRFTFLAGCLRKSHLSRLKGMNLAWTRAFSLQSKIN